MLTDKEYVQFWIPIQANRVRRATTQLNRLLHKSSLSKQTICTLYKSYKDEIDDALMKLEALGRYSETEIKEGDSVLYITRDHGTYINPNTSKPVKYTQEIVTRGIWNGVKAVCTEKYDPKQLKRIVRNKDLLLKAL